MRSKVLTEAMADAQPLAWRRSLPIPTKAARPVADGAPDEILQLRARITESNAIAEQQARQAYETGLRNGEGVARKALEAETRAAIDRLAATMADVASTRADIIRRAMVRMDDALTRERLTARMLLQVHDELIFEVPDAEVERTLHLVKKVMVDAPKPAIALTVPLQVDARAADNWEEAH